MAIRGVLLASAALMAFASQAAMAQGAGDAKDDDNGAGLADIVEIGRAHF